MTAPSRSQAEQALAAFLHAVRPDWATPGILATIRRKPTAPLDQLAAAAIYATTRRDQHTPHLIAEDDGAAFDRLTGKGDRAITPTPTRGCPYHAGQPKACPECVAERQAAADPSPYIAAIRQAIRDNRQEQQ